jgi:HAE1 family hydrophobic/amphiphilic exporter-1
VSAPEFAVRRPVTIAMATVAVAVFGFLAARTLPIELLPDLSYPTLTIQTVYSDAAPEAVEFFITRPVEEAVGVIPGVRDMRSVSRASLSEVVLEFEWDDLPREAENAKVLRFDPSLEPVMRLGFGGERPLIETRQLAERWLKPRLESVRGVAAARVRGGLEPEIQVEADEDRLAAFGLTLDDLAGALRSENVNRPGGTVRDWGTVYLVRTLHEFVSLEQVRRTVVRETADGRVRVEDVAEVRRGAADRLEITRSGSTEAVEIALYREGSANTVAVAAAVQDELRELERSMPADLRLELLADQSAYVSGAIDQVRFAGLIGGLLAVLVLYFFLRDLRATAIIALTIPISVIATFLPLQQGGVSLNIMSLGGLALGIGMLVDNSIVVLEAIDRRRRAGESRRQAAVHGASEVAGAVFAATLTTICVFLPIVFVEGVAGQLFRDLALTVCLALLASLAVSLTLIPALASLGPEGSDDEAAATEQETVRTWLQRVREFILPPRGDRAAWKHGVLLALTLPLRLILALPLLAAGVLLWLIGLAWMAFAWAFQALSWPASRGFDLIGKAYAPLLSTSLRLRWLVVPAAFLLFGLSLLVAGGLGRNLVPNLSQGEFAFQVRLPAGTPLESTAQVVERIEAQFEGDPLFARVFSVVGSLPSTASGRQTLGENLAQVNVALPEGAALSAEERAVARVREVLALFPRVEGELVRGSAMSTRPPVVVNVYSDDLETLDAAALEVEAALAALPALADVGSTIEPGNPEIRVEIDRERAAELGVTAEQLGTSLRRQVRGETVGRFREAEDRLDIRLRSSASSRDRAEEVGRLRLRLADGTAVPVTAVSDVRIERGPAAIHRADGARVAQVTARVPVADLGQVLDDVRATVAELTLPGDATAGLAGQEEEMKVSFDSLKLALGLAVFLVYVVMAMQFESLLHPFVILLSVPLGVVGVVAALVLTGRDLDVLVLIGCVMLAGIVVNNAIVLVDAVNRRRREGEDIDGALRGAGRERLRPILMTTTTTVLGLMPMAFGLGPGDELRAPLAITVIGGLLGATILTLVVIPCLFRSLTPSGTGAKVEPAS